MCIIYQDSRNVSGSFLKRLYLHLFMYLLYNLQNYFIIAPLWKSGSYTGFALSFRHSVIPSFRNISNENFSSNFSQELWGLEDWNLEHT